MNENKARELFSKISFVIFIAIWLIAVGWALLDLLQPVGRYFALDKPAWKIGVKNAGQIIDAIELYKSKHGFYPQDPYEAFNYNPSVIPYLSDYEYEMGRTKENSQEYMLSFRKRWTANVWYCYYSGDQTWVQSAATCWSSPRPANNFNG